MVVTCKNKTNLFQICLGTFILLLSILNNAKAGHYPNPASSPYSCDYLGIVNIDGINASIDTEVAFFDPDNVICGLYIVKQRGEYGIVHIYGDDPDTNNIDEGASINDILTVKIWDNVKKVEYSGEDLHLTKGNVQNGFFTQSAIPPIWQNQTGFILNIDTKSHFAPPTKTPYICNYIGNITINGELIDIGDEIGIFDPNGVLCGHFRIKESGRYGMVHIYGDNPSTLNIDEGAEDGDVLTFKIWDNDLSKEWQTSEELFIATEGADGSFNNSFLPPVWTKDTGYILNITVNPIIKADPSINSMTNKSTVTISWNESSNAKGFSWIVDKSTDTKPDEIIMGSNLPGLLNFDQGEGIYYVHIKSVNTNDEWSPSFHIGPWQLVEGQLLAPVVTGDSFTNNVRPTWKWKSAGEPGTGSFRFQLNSENAQWTETQETSFTANTDLESSNILYVQEKDIFGEWSISGSFMIIIDTIPPNKVNISGISITNNTRPIWTWNSGGGGNGEFRYQIDGEIVNLWIITTDKSYTPSTEFNDGESHIIYVQERDEAGNWSESAYFETQIDTSPPNKVNVSGVSPTNNTKPTWNWNSGGGDGIGEFRYQLDGKIDNLWIITTEASYTSLTEFNDGESHILFIQERDYAGNWSETAKFEIQIDTSPPNKVNVSGISPTNNAKPTWNWNSGGGGGIGEFRFQLNGEMENSWNITTENSYTPYTEFNDTETHILFVQERDEAGNWSESAYFGIQIDKIPPNKVNLSGNTLTNNTRPTWKWISGGGGNGEFRYQIDGEIVNSWIITTETSYTSLKEFNDGESHIIYVQERDEAGNWSESAYFETQIDTSPPNKVNVSGVSPTNNTKPTWNWNSGGGDGIGEFRYQLDGKIDNLWIITTETSYTSLKEFNDGESHILYVQERDEAANWSETAEFKIQIDTSPPNKVNVSGVSPSNNPRPTWNWISGGENGNGKFRYQINDQLDNLWNPTTESSYTALTDFYDGEKRTLYVQEQDDAGNWSNSGSFTIVYYVYVDSDNDGLSDEDEIYYGTNINKADTDEDGINDYDELIIYETDPINVDTDDDGIKDGKEIADNTNAKDKNSFNLNRPPEIPTVWVDSPDEIITTDNVWLQSSNYKDKDINEIHAKTYWKVKRADISVYECCDEPFSFSFVATKSDSEEYMTKYNITGLISGFQYIYMVGYEGSESTFISWSYEQLITVGETEQDNNLKIKKGIELADYQMVSFVQWMKNPISIDVLGNDIWEKYGKSFKFGTYNPLFGAGGYIEYGENLIVQPGKSYWFLAADGYNVSTNGVPVSTSENIYVKLTYNETDKNGWNMIACPNNSDYYWDDIELFVTNENWDIIFPKTPISDLDEHDTPYIFNFLWRWENGTYEPDTQKMIRYKGYWVNVNTEDVSTENVYLIFPEKHQKNFIKSDLLKKQKNAPSRLRKKSLELCGSPPLPIEVIDESKSSGCFIEMIFSSLGIIGY